MSEATAVAEEVITEAPPEAVNDAPLSDAGLPTSTDAAVPVESETPVIPDNVDDYVKQVLDKESAAQTPEAQPAKPGVDPAVFEQRLGAFRNNYANRQGRLDALGQKLKDAGYSSIETDAILKEAKDILNEHHADSLANGHFEATATTWSNATNQIMTAIHSTLPKDMGKAYNDALGKAAEAAEGKQASIADAISIATEMVGKAAVEGYKSNFLPALIRKAYEDGREAAEKVAAGASSGQSVDGAGTRRTGPLTVEEAESLPVNELAAIRARENGQ